MCDDPSFDYSEQLAIKYNISIDECHHSYFEYLLTNSNLSLNEIRKKLKPFLSSERIKKNRQIKLDLVKRLHSNVFPFIEGKDYERLKLFYDIKRLLGDSTHAQKHIQAIQQLMNILNYGKK
jgi:predicted Zn-dependent peptidase